MVGLKRSELFEPKIGELREDLALARDAVGHDAVEGGDAVGGYEKQPVGVQAVHIADLAAGVKFQFREVGLQQDGI